MAIDVGRDYGFTDAAIRAALKQPGDLFFSAGIYKYTDVIPCISRKFIFSPSTILEAQNKAKCAIVLSGQYPALHGEGLRKICPSAELPQSPPDWTKRLSDGNSASIFILKGTRNFLVENIQIDRAGSSGIMNWGGLDGIISGNSVKNTLADGIHNTNGANGCRVENNTVDNVGDDMIAVVSYQKDGGHTQNIEILNNQLLGQPWGRGISVVGGKLIKILDNYIEDSYGAGVLIATEESWQSLDVDGVEISRNKFVRPARVIHNANILVSGMRAGYSVKNVSGIDNVYDPSKPFIRKEGSYENITISDKPPTTTPPTIPPTIPPPGGSMAVSLAQLEDAVKAAAPGSTVRVLPGTATVQINLRDIRKTAPVKIVPDDPANPPKFMGNNTMNGYPGLWIKACTGIDVSGMLFMCDKGDGIRVENDCHNVRIHHNVFRLCGMMGIYLSGVGTPSSDIEIYCNEFDRNGDELALDPHDPDGNGLHDIYWGGGSAGPGIIGGKIYNNWMHDGQNGQRIQIGPYSQDVQIFCNTIERITQPAGQPDWFYAPAIGTFGAGVSGALIANNVIWDVPGPGMQVRYDSKAVLYKNFLNKMGKKAQFGCIYQANNGVADIKETQECDTLGDFKLVKGVPAADSPLVGKANPNYMPSVDFNGKPRTSKTPGAFEPVGVVTPIPPDPIPPAKLRVKAETPTSITLEWDVTPEQEGFLPTIDGSETLIDGKRHPSTNQTDNDVVIGKKSDGQQHDYGVSILVQKPLGTIRR